MTLQKPGCARDDVLIISVEADGVVRRLEQDDLCPDTPIVNRFPYGATVLPKTDSCGNAVVVFLQPGCQGRTDVLVIEQPDSVATLRDRYACEQGEGKVRIRVPMSHTHSGELPDSAAIFRVRTSLGCGRHLDSDTLRLLTSIRYTIRAGDMPGWFEVKGPGAPSAPFRHGYPDIATREQGAAGIRGPSWLTAEAPRIRDSDSRPRLANPLPPGRRVIYELHVGTFTETGSLSAAARRLEGIARLGFTTVQLMPIDLSSGVPGWTYDQTRTGAVDSALYGGASELIQFVTQAHSLALEVIVDKQYNHQGAEQDSRSCILPGMFSRTTQWGAGLSGEESPHYAQIVKLIGEEFAYWTMYFGIDGLRLDATNRLPWEMHGQLASFADQISSLANKPLYLLSEYAECEPPVGYRTPTGHQYADQPGRYLMKLLSLSNARHVLDLPSDDGSLLRPMLKSARRGWWYPEVPDPPGGLRGAQRSTSLLWHHDWIGNRFGGERISALIDFELFKTIAVWQVLGQWTPLLFMGTERYSQTPWYFFTGHQDEETQNNTSASYCERDGRIMLCGGRYAEFASEAQAAGLREALAFSSDGKPAGIDWGAFRKQLDRLGHPYMDHGRSETFLASKLDWAQTSPQQAEIEALFGRLLPARSDPRLAEEDPQHAQYKLWCGNEHVFVLRRRDFAGNEFICLFNLGVSDVTFTLDREAIELEGAVSPFIIPLVNSQTEAEWAAAGKYSLWFSTRGDIFEPFQISGHQTKRLLLKGPASLVFSRVP